VQLVEGDAVLLQGRTIKQGLKSKAMDKAVAAISGNKLQCIQLVSPNSGLFCHANPVDRSC
jgi:hypothetical protein